MAPDASPLIYQAHVWIRQISPMIWRQRWVRSDSTLADLHDTIQIAFGWTDVHLHRFRLRGKDYGIPLAYGPWYSTDAREVTLEEFSFRHNERFLDEYDFGALWQHEVRMEQRLPVVTGRLYPMCIGGRHSGPPEDCGDPWAFMVRRDAVFWEAEELLDELIEGADAGDRDAVEDSLARVCSMRPWLSLERFDRREINRRLTHYALGEEGWSWT